MLLKWLMVSIIFKERIILDLQTTYKLSEITRIFEIKRHFVIHLVEKGIIEPLVDVKGRGKSRLYSYNNLVEIGIFIYLNNLNLSYEMATRILNNISKHIKHHTEETIETMPYICVLGFLDGGMDITVTEPTRFFSDKLSPEAFLSKMIKNAIEERDDITSIDDFAYYFVLDVKNIVSYINYLITIT